MIEGVSKDIVYSEIYEIINVLGEEFKNKIPPKIYMGIEKKRNKKYSPNFITQDNKIDENKISKEAISFFTYLNLKYFIEDENEIARYKNILCKKS